MAKDHRIKLTPVNETMLAAANVAVKQHTGRELSLSAEINTLLQTRLVSIHQYYRLPLPEELDRYYKEPTDAEKEKVRLMPQKKAGT